MNKVWKLCYYAHRNWPLAGLHTFWSNCNLYNLLKLLSSPHCIIIIYYTYFDRQHSIPISTILLFWWLQWAFIIYFLRLNRHGNTRCSSALEKSYLCLLYINNVNSFNRTQHVELININLWIKFNINASSKYFTYY